MAHAGRSVVRNLFDRAGALIVAATLALGILLWTAVPAVACSCMGPQPMAAYRGDPTQAIFTGVVQAPEARGVPVRVTRWFQGPSPDPLVWLDGRGFGVDGASCGTPLPPAGTEWIFVAYRTETGQLGVHLCTPHAAASDATGQAMFADAVATFGQGLVMDPVPAPTPTTSPAAPAGLPLPLPVVGVMAIAVVALAAGLGLLLIRGRRAGA